MCTNNSDYKGSDEIIASAMGRRNLLKTNAFVLRTLVWCCMQVQCSCSITKRFWSHMTVLVRLKHVLHRYRTLISPRLPIKDWQKNFNPKKNTRKERLVGTDGFPLPLAEEQKRNEKIPTPKQETTTK